MELKTNSGPSKQKSNFVFNGYGGSEKVSIFDISSDIDDEESSETDEVERKRKVKVQSSTLRLIKPKTISLDHRLKTGGLRNFQIDKDKTKT